jgi:hypothetical protein
VPNILVSVLTKKVKQPLSVTHPELAKEADGWDPSTLTAGSGRKMPWKCLDSHLWNASVSSRAKGNGCPICANKILVVGQNDLASRYPELAKEAFGWDPREILSGTNKKLKWKCKDCSFVWVTSANSRISRGRGCPACAHQVVSSGINDLLTLYPEIADEADGWDPNSVLAHSGKKLLWRCKEFGHSYSATVTNRTSNGRGCPICAGKILVPGFNDLLTTHPDIARSAFGWDPQTYGFSSKARLPWLCEAEGHIFHSQINNRANRNDQCPICSGKEVLKGFNDLGTVNASLAAEAFEWDPTTTTISSGVRRRWKCSEGHIWIATPSNRNLGTGCPSCAQWGFSPNDDGFIYLLRHPEWEMLQIGITNIPDDRLRRHRRLRWELLELRGPMDGHLTQQWETAILRMLKARGADLSNEKIAGKFDGYSEAWSKSTFEVNSIKELMRLTEEFENK